LIIIVSSYPLALSIHSHPKLAYRAHCLGSVRIIANSAFQPHYCNVKTSATG